MNILQERAQADRTEHWRAFDHTWFARNQPLLLWALNTPILGKMVRGLLRIHMADVWMPHNTSIIEIAPNYYTVRLPDGQLRTDFRTHWKYSKRVYYAFKEIWWLMHAWDAAFADRWTPSLSWGFASLEVYPDPNPETTTVDGRVARFGVDEIWATIRAGAGGFSDDSVATDDGVTLWASTTSNQWAYLFRSIFLFDTAAIDDAGTITAAVLSLHISVKSDALSTTPDIDIYTSTPASNTALANADFSQIGTTSQTGSPIAYASVSTAAYNDFTFSATGRGNVSRTGVSKFGARNANKDVANVEPAWVSGASSGFRPRYADTTGTTTDPKLVVTYTPSQVQPPRSMHQFRQRRRTS